MGTTINKVREDIVDGLRDLKADSLNEVLDFIYFLKAKQVINPFQAYFWTRTWQRLEEEAEKDKRAGRVIGNGSVKGLLKALKT